MRPDLNLDYALLVPEYILGLLALAIIVIDLMMPKIRKDALPFITAGGLAVAFAVSLLYIDTDDNFAGLLSIDDYTTFFRCFFIAVTFVTVLASAQYVQTHLRHPGEYYSLLVISTVGAIYMAAAQELLTAYIALELLSFSLYVLVSYAKMERRSNEAGMKYMLLGAFASALLLYGISFIYGASGSTSYAEIAAAFEGGTEGFTFGTLIGLTLIVAGLGFKVAAVPFHMWTPDAYEGAPLPITAYLSATSKAAGFALLLRLFSGALMPVIDDWQFMLAAVSAITMALGNLIAIQQRNIKRLLAYSSIGQVGYMLMGITALSPEVSSALLLHMTGYVITNMAAFTAIIAYHNASGAEDVSDFRGASDRAPLLAAVLTVALFSLAGMPLFAGFLTKFILFQSVADNGYFWLAALGVVASLVSLYYYLTVIKEMYVSAPPDSFQQEGRFRIPLIMQGAVIVLTLGVFFVGLYPAPLFELTDSVAAVLFTS
ncbi:MAG: NADH-quinone oxidoreductase subunit NuoN [Dehalococcoidia bacterium]|nr:NADH-quinone oxidoreductase subunit NuoN [Dehalococcoidia bacterium]